MTLLEKQWLFMTLVPALILKAHTLGFKVTGGDLYRDPRAFGEIGQPGAYGRRRSNHKARLAIDLNLFKDGKYCTATEDHRELGEWWEQQHELCRWGGHFGDGNHYSLEHQGRQ